MNKRKEKPRTLDSTWKLCLKMWKDVNLAYEILQDNRASTIHRIKETWLAMNGFNPFEISYACFFCDWAERNGQEELSPDEPGTCVECPGVKVSKEFSCQLEKTDWRYNPVEFYQLLKKLDKKRRLQVKNERK